MKLSTLGRARTRSPIAAALTAVLALAGAGCAKPEAPPAKGAGAGSSADVGQQVVAPSPGAEGCTIGEYGAKELDLENATVGFSQSEKEANPFRIAETESIRDEAEKRGVKLLTANAQSRFSKQISDVRNLLAKGADLLIIAPLNSDGWEPVLRRAAAKQVPIVTIDRKINAEPCKDYVSFIGSDFEEQGKRAADLMIEATGGKGKVAILLGSAGNNVTTERTRGFKERIKEKAPDLEVVFEQTANFSRGEGQRVTEQLIQSNPGITGIYAENDEMGLGAVNALKSAGKEPGDIEIVTVDGTRNAVQAIVDGWIHGVVESNPRFGPLAFETLESFTRGEEVAQEIVVRDDVYTEDNAEQNIGNAY